MKRSYTAVIEKRGEWYIGYIEEVPGANTQGRTLKEVRDNLKEALVLVLDVQKELGRELSKPDKIISETISINV